MILKVKQYGILKESDPSLHQPSIDCELRHMTLIFIEQEGGWMDHGMQAWPSPPPQQTPESFGDKNRSYRARSLH